MSEFPIPPSKTAMLFFDILNTYLHSDDAERRADVQKNGILSRIQTINRACREAGIAVLYAQADHRQDFRDSAPVSWNAPTPTRQKSSTPKGRSLLR